MILRQLKTKKNLKKLPDDAAVDLQAEFEKSQVQEVLDKLDNELVGLVPVKTRIKEIAALLVGGSFAPTL